MSWDGLYTHQRIYPQFEVGDEVYAVKQYKALTKREGYIVLKCYNPYPHRPDLNAWCITLLNDYTTYRFRKTERQLREDKIKSILEWNQEI